MNIPKPTRGAASAERRQHRARKLTAYRAACAAVDAQGPACAVCGISSHWLGFHHHHVQKRSQGGADTVENLLRVCGACHARLHATR